MPTFPQAAIGGNEYLSAPAKLLKLRAVIERTSLSRSSIYNMARRGMFPQPLALGDKRVAWNSAEVDAWIAGRIAADPKRPGLGRA